MGAEEQQISLPAHPVILVATDLSPSDTAALDRDKILGFCTAAGGPTAHSAIIARALSLPAVVSAGEAVLDIDNLTTIVLNGTDGTITIQPDAEAISQAETQKQQWQSAIIAAQENATEPAITEDGHRVEVVANIGGLADAEKAAESGAEGVRNTDAELFDIRGISSFQCRLSHLSGYRKAEVRRCQYRDRPGIDIRMRGRTERGSGLFLRTIRPPPCRGICRWKGVQCLPFRVSHGRRHAGRGNRFFGLSR